jgi:hypothetical protein
MVQTPRILPPVYYWTFRTTHRRYKFRCDRSEIFRFSKRVSANKTYVQRKRQAEHAKGEAGDAISSSARHSQCIVTGHRRGEERIAGVVRGSWVVCWNGWPRLPFSPARAPRFSPRTSPLPLSLYHPDLTRPPPQSQPLHILLLHLQLPSKLALPFLFFPSLSLSPEA